MTIHSFMVLSPNRLRYRRAILDVTTSDVTAASYCNGASKCNGAAEAKAEARKTKDYKPKVDGIQT